MNSPRIAVMGASGFLGSRVVEMFHLGAVAEVRPVVRGFQSLARLARFELDWRVADARDETALTAAFEGCDYVIHSVTGDPDVIEDSVTPVYRAACKSKVKRLVYLSSGSVHGQAPAPGTDETSALSDRQALEYNNAKVRAERRLLDARTRGGTEIVILRPGIVFGPRDRWISVLADALLAGTACLVNGGEGICNTLYVDNLVHAIQRALTASSVDREAFLLGDRETVTWERLYRGVSGMLGIPFEQIRQVPPVVPRKNFRDHVDHFRGLPAVQKLLPVFPSKIKRAVKAALAAMPEPVTPSPWTLPRPSAPAITFEMSELQQCRWKFPHEKATRLLGYDPGLSFDKGLHRTAGWLQFAGYPVRGKDGPA